MMDDYDPLEDVLSAERWRWRYAAGFSGKFDSFGDARVALEENERFEQLIKRKGDFDVYVRPFREQGSGPRIGYACQTCDAAYIGAPKIRIGDGEELEFSCEQDHLLS